MMKTPAYRYRTKDEKDGYRMNPRTFTMWAFLVTVTMLFAAFTSAMVVARADAIEKGFWQSFHIPITFTVSTIVIALSSISMQWARSAARKDEVSHARLALGITLALGTAFVMLQWRGYGELVAQNVFVAGRNINGSFFYVVSGVHALHVVGGIFFVAATLVAAYRYRVHSRDMMGINLCATYWHFIGGLWIYLFALLNVLS